MNLRTRENVNWLASTLLRLDRHTLFQPGPRLALPKKSFLIARFQHAAILYNHAHPPAEMQRLQEVFHGPRKHLGRPHLPPEFDKVLSFVAVIHTTAHDW